MASNSTLKRAGSPKINESTPKRFKRAYHHNHRLQYPVTPLEPEPALTDVACVDLLLNRSLGLLLVDAGFNLADPVALDGLRNATEECKQYSSKSFY